MKKLRILLLIFSGSLSLAKGQTNSAVKSHPIIDTANILPQQQDSVFNYAQQMPKYNGDIFKMINDSMQYPQEDAVGTVYISFIVETDGSINSIKVLRGIPGAPDFDKEAIRLVSLLKNWKPGMQNGKPVRVKYNIPIRFEEGR